ncbi:MAG: VOC family protein [Pseudomonadota bacterium]
MATSPGIIPYFSYADGHAAVAFLEAAVGFHVVQTADAEDGSLLRCEMARGMGLIMMGTGETAKGTPGTYVVVEDVHEHHDRAVAAGAEIVYGVETTEWGTKRYRCRDLEGHEWTSGSYAPSTEPPRWA